MATTATWHLLAENDRLRRSSQAFSALGAEAFVFGGELLPREPVDNSVDRISVRSGGPSAETLSAPSTAPSRRVGSPSATAGDAVYLFSGRGGIAMAPVEEHGAVWGYTPRDNVWEAITPADASAPIPAGRSYHCLASDGNDTIFLHAGCPESGRLADLWAFNLTSRTWTQLPDAPPPARGGASIAFQDGKLYRLNGFDGHTEQGGALDIYDVAAGSWSTHEYKPDGADGPESRSVAALVALEVGGKKTIVTLFGERDPSSLGHAGAGKMLGDAWAFDVQTKKWAKIEVGIGKVPAPRGWFDADVAEEEGKQFVVVHGGLAEDNSRLGDVWKLEF
ncbi:kelch repeat protein [Plectosphaerella plurivora]|uniref:Kelch repeat protein n=1 Tax=Plectosphaerella plurivora TaxID=936078 RepID=A0A9P9ADN1_9PEZI|nr:kelch repeat protein [Plectosphaerella plurivora]